MTSRRPYMELLPRTAVLQGTRSVRDVHIQDSVLNREGGMAGNQHVNQVGVFQQAVANLCQDFFLRHAEGATVWNLVVGFGLEKCVLAGYFCL